MHTIMWESFSTFPSVHQHPPITKSTALLQLWQLLKIFFQVYPWVTLPSHLPRFFCVFFFLLFLNHPFLYTTCKIKALSNYFNNLAVTQNMKRRFKLVPFKGDATMTASHKHVPKYWWHRIPQSKGGEKASRLTGWKAWFCKVSEGGSRWQERHGI